MSHLVELPPRTGVLCGRVIIVYLLVQGRSTSTERRHGDR
jgi:hypothetical protein